MNPRTPTGQAPEAPLIDYNSVRDGFLVWFRAKGVTEDYIRELVSVLDRFFKPISGPGDIPRMFQGLSRGQRNNLLKALRNLFNFYESLGYDPFYLDLLRRALPKTCRGYDIKVPGEEDIVNALRILRGYEGYYALFNVILDSGLRIVEAVNFIEAYKSGAIGLEACGGFYYAQINMLRGKKNAYIAFITDYTKGLLDRTEKNIGYERARKMKERLGLKDKLISCKYLRKFVFDKMIELEIPESVADFIQGRTPIKVCAKHYMNLLKQAITYYPRYAEYLRALRAKASI